MSIAQLKPMLAEHDRLSPAAVAALALVFLLFGTTTARGQSPANVLVVVNTESQASVDIGEHYVKARAVPETQVVRVKVAVADEIARNAYELAIEAPIARWLTEHALEDRIHYIVLTKGLPLRIAGTTGRQATTASVDSELTLLYRKLTGGRVNTIGPIENPYFLGDAEPSAAKPFTRKVHDIYLVTRLDAFTVADAKALVDRALRAERRGRVVLDMKASLSEAGNRALDTAARRLESAGFGEHVLLERTGDVVSGERDILGYYSWGSSDPAIKQRVFDLAFVPGAIAGMFVSSDARTFTAPPDTWTVGDWRNRASYYAGSPQSLTGDLVREGVTGVAGYVAEPFLDGTVRPDILFPAYFQGLSLAEVYYLAMPYLSWQAVVIGDPLCRIGPAPEVSAGDMDGGIDPATGYPQYLSARRIEQMATSAPRANRDALTRFVKAQRHLALGDSAAARTALEEAIALDGSVGAMHMALADIYTRQGEHELAIARYEAALAQQPRDVVALNNLAYALAVHRGKPADALPLAQRAYALAGQSALVADTLGWVHYLLGNTRDAFSYLRQAVSGLPRNGEVRFHWAAVLAAAGDRQAARRELEAALKLDSTLAERADVKKFQD
ncbi:MAG: TIGR03790 family protein, partial [Vicinamibacteraceae bacterium]|nr:TIGR03790 family protein [Vicinamibacteraceae bacterium]